MRIRLKFLVTFISIIVVFSMCVEVFPAVSAQTYSPTVFSHKALLSYYNIFDDNKTSNSNINVSYIYSNFNKSLNSNINAIKNISNKFNFTLLYVKNLKSEISNSFTMFLSLSKLINDTALYNHFTWDLSYNFRDNITLANFSLTFVNNKKEVMYTYSFNESNPFSSNLTVKVLPVITLEHTATIPSTNWAGYEYYSQSNSGNTIKGINTYINVPDQQEPPNQHQGWMGLASWVGLSEYSGGNGILAQTGYIIYYYWLWPFGGYSLVYEVYPQEPVEYYPGNPGVNPGNIIFAQVLNQGSNGFVFEIIDTNTSVIYTTTYEINSPLTNYGQYIVEAPTYSGKITQILEFHPSVQFSFPQILITSYWMNPIAAWSENIVNYNEYILNQTPDLNNHNIDNQIIWDWPYYMSFSWRNSNYDL